MVEDLHRPGISVSRAWSSFTFRAGGLSGHWEQVQPDGIDQSVVIEQQRETAYVGRPLDCVTDLFRSIRSSLWSVVTTTGAHRKYYLNCDHGLGNHRLPTANGLPSTFCSFIFPTSPVIAPSNSIVYCKVGNGPQIESFLAECPSQFLFLMASELLQREVAPADLA